MNGTQHSKTYRNINFARRNYECTNIVACVADAAPGENWQECDETILRGLTQLWIEKGVRYFGWL
jgi:hypothetical protein